MLAADPEGSRRLSIPERLHESVEASAGPGHGLLYAGHRHGQSQPHLIAVPLVLHLLHDTRMDQPRQDRLEEGIRIDAEPLPYRRLVHGGRAEKAAQEPLHETEVVVRNLHCRFRFGRLAASDFESRPPQLLPNLSQIEQRELIASTQAHNAGDVAFLIKRRLGHAFRTIELDTFEIAVQKRAVARKCASVRLVA